MQQPIRDQSSQHSAFAKLPKLVLVGLASGLSTALMISVFRWLLTLPEASFEGFAINTDSPWVRFLIPVVGALLLWAFWRAQAPSTRSVGIPHVYERLSYHHGDLPGRNLLNQLVGAVIAIGSGQPVGREGPGVHIGSAVSSWLGMRSGISLSHQRLLIGCGSAAAIAALFNTPLAGVLFAMEVILLQYSLVGFSAVIVAAVSADAMTRHLFGAPELAGYLIPELSLFNQAPILLVLTLVISIAALIFQQITVYTSQYRKKGMGKCLITAGIIVGVCAAIDPVMMTPVHLAMERALDGVYDINQLIMLMVFFLAVSPFVIGLGIPGGLIGPTLTTGALLGALMATGDSLFGTSLDSTTLSLIGMAAMLSAVIHAPLAALVTVFELTGSIEVMTLAMSVIVLSDLMMRSLFKKASIFERLLAVQGISRDTRVYRRVLMSTSVKDLIDPAVIDQRDAGTIDKTDRSAWHLLMIDQHPCIVSQEELISDHKKAIGMPFITLNKRATLLQALDLMQERKTDRLAITHHKNVLGILTYEHIQSFYQNYSD